MFLVISWLLGGAVVGGIGVTGIASAVSTGPRGDIETAVVLLLIGVIGGAIGGGLLGRMLRRKFAGDERKLGLITALPWIAGFALVVGINVYK